MIDQKRPTLHEYKSLPTNIERGSETFERNSVVSSFCHSEWRFVFSSSCLCLGCLSRFGSEWHLAQRSVRSDGNVQASLTAKKLIEGVNKAEQLKVLNRWLIPNSTVSSTETLIDYYFLLLMTASYQDNP
jgi:hypothetical protein